VEYSASVIMMEWPTDFGNDGPDNNSEMTFSVVSEQDCEIPLWSQDSSVCSSEPVKAKGY
jgi:hypothetical protein